MKRPDVDQGERIHQLSLDILEAFLTGKAALVIEPLPANDGAVASQVGQITVLHGFTVRLRKD